MNTIIQHSKTIGVVCHKPCPFPSDSMYLPIQVGFGSDIDGAIRDNVGNNIAEKNASYCELTAQWWLWKNCSSEIKGLVHYRRMLSNGQKCRANPFESISARLRKVLTSDVVDALLEHCDVILPEPHHYLTETALEHYNQNHVTGYIFNNIRNYLIRTNSEYVIHLDNSLASKQSHLYNIIIARSSVFDAYSEWLFGVLADIENSVDLEVLSVSEKRVFGYLSELLLDVWISKNESRYVELPVLFMEKQNLPKRFLLGGMKKIGIYDPVREER